MSEMISVIIPVYNHAKTIKRSVLTLLAQSYRPLEVIIVNDGSTDNFSKAINDIISDERFTVLNIRVINQENRGAPAARNNGFQKATGEYVIFFDADTIAEPEMLSKMHSALASAPGAAYAYSGFKFGWKKMKPVGFDADLLKKNNYIDVSSLIRRAGFPGFDESIKKFQDWDLWLTMLEKNKTGVCVPEILYKKLVGGREGISQWMPGFAYRLPWKNRAIRRFEEARLIIQKKHGLGL